MSQTTEQKIKLAQQALIYIETGLFIGICDAVKHAYLVRNNWPPLIVNPVWLLPELRKFRPITKGDKVFWFEYGTVPGRRKREIILKEIILELKEQLYEKMEGMPA